MGQCPRPDTKSVLWVMGWLRAGAGTTLSSSLQAPPLRSAAVGKRGDPEKKDISTRCRWERWEEKPAVPFPRVYSAEQQLQLDGNFSAGLTLKPNDNAWSVCSVCVPAARSC